MTMTRSVDGTSVEFSESEESEFLAERIAWIAKIQPALVPQSATPLQARRALLNANLLDAVNAAVANADTSTKLAWEFASSIERNSEFVATLTEKLSLTDSQLDALFIDAAKY